jgi:hypothetical protein
MQMTENDIPIYIGGIALIAIFAMIFLDIFWGKPK